jgi:hypothetical protein
MQYRRRSHKIVELSAFFVVAGVRKVESRERIALPVVPSAMGHAGAWMLQSGLVGAQEFLNAVRGPGTRSAVSPTH